MTLYEKFNLLLQDNNITPYRIHKETGISTATLSDWKNGKSEPKKDKIQKICTFFDIPISYFYENEVAPQNLLTGESNYSEVASFTTLKAERDVAKIFGKTIEELLNGEPIYLNGKEISEEQLRKLNNTIEAAMNMIGYDKSEDK